MGLFTRVKGKIIPIENLEPKGTLGDEFDSFLNNRNASINQGGVQPINLSNNYVTQKTPGRLDFYTPQEYWLNSGRSQPLKSVTMDEIIRLLKTELEPGPVLVICEHCGGWAAVQTACVHCGAAVGVPAR